VRRRKVARMAQETLEVVYATGVRTSGLLPVEEQSISKSLCIGVYWRTFEICSSGGIQE